MFEFSPNTRSSLLKLGCLTLALGVSACASTPEPVVEAPETVAIEDMVVEVFQPAPEVKPEPVPSITIEEYERQQAAIEAARQAELAALAPPPEPAPKPVVPQTLEQRLAAASTPDRKIAILSREPESTGNMVLILEAYQNKLAADRASGDNEGAADALVYLGQLDLQGGTREDQMEALSKFAEALQLDPENAEAPSLVSASRGNLQSYSDTLHKEAVALFVKQDFVPAVDRWEKVLLIDPGNTAARNWYTQAKESISR